MNYSYLIFSILIGGFTCNVQAVPKAEEGTSFTDESTLLDFERLPSAPSEGLYGMSWLDFDGDQDLDLFVPGQPGGLNALYRNDNGTFVNVAISAGVAGGTGHAGAVSADINNDGCTDLFVIGAGGIGSVASNSTPHKLYKNNCDGTGTFSDITADSGITAPHPAMMAAFGDIDNDGDLDLFITSPGSFVSGLTPQTLYLNKGDETFSDISVASGINSSLGGCVVNFVDLDKDGYQDILVGNCNNLAFPDGVGTDRGIPIPGPWELWHNNGNNSFTDVADAAGLNIRPGFPMALTIADIDNDGDLDIFATGLGVFFSHPDVTPFGLLTEQVLFENNGDGTFSDATYSHGLGGFNWGWGATFADFDADGDEDLVHVGSMPPIFGVVGPGLASPGRLYQNDGNGNMSGVEVFDLQDDFVTGLAAADYDGNGFVDVIIAKTAHNFSSLFGVPFSGNGELVLLSNNGNRNNSITVALKGTTSNVNGIGARVEAKTGNITRTKVVFAGTSFASDNGPWLTFGLGQRKSVKLQVTWPSGLIEKFNHVAANQLVTLEEGTGIPVKNNTKNHRH